MSSLKSAIGANFGGVTYVGERDVATVTRATHQESIDAFSVLSPQDQLALAVAKEFQKYSCLEQVTVNFGRGKLNQETGEFPVLVRITHGELTPPNGDHVYHPVDVSSISVLRSEIETVEQTGPLADRILLEFTSVEQPNVEAAKAVTLTT